MQPTWDSVPDDPSNAQSSYLSGYSEYHSTDCGDRLTLVADVAQAARPKARGGEYANGEAVSALENYANNVSRGDKPAGQGAKRELRWKARRGVQEFTNHARLRGCGVTSIRVDGKVTLKHDGQHAGFGGLATCGSVWVCPVCSAKVAARRAAEIEQILDWNADRGGSVIFTTLTLRHHKGQSLVSLWHNGLSAAWRYMTQQRAWSKTRKALGIDHYVRAVEITYGEHGWHVHAHLLLLVNRPISSDMADAFGAELFSQWQRAVRREGHDTLPQGFDIRVADRGDHLDELGRYFAKQVYDGQKSSMAIEATGAAFKEAKNGNRTPFQMLADILNTGLMDDIEAWWEYESASKGRRQINTSQKLKALAGVEVKEDEEIAREELDGETLLTMTRSAWKVVYPVAAKLLAATETGGISGARAFLDFLGAEYELGDTTVGPMMQRTMHSRREHVELDEGDIFEKHRRLRYRELKEKSFRALGM